MTVSRFVGQCHSVIHIDQMKNYDKKGKHDKTTQSNQLYIYGIRIFVKCEHVSFIDDIWLWQYYMLFVHTMCIITFNMHDIVDLQE